MSTTYSHPEGTPVDPAGPEPGSVPAEPRTEVARSAVLVEPGAHVFLVTPVDHAPPPVPSVSPPPDRGWPVPLTAPPPAPEPAAEPVEVSVRVTPADHPHSQPAGPEGPEAHGHAVGSVGWAETGSPPAAVVLPAAVPHAPDHADHAGPAEPVERPGGAGVDGNVDEATHRGWPVAQARPAEAGADADADATDAAAEPADPAHPDGPEPGGPGGSGGTVDLVKAAEPTSPDGAAGSPEAADSADVGDVDDAREGECAAPGPVIRNGATTEIPVHLLFHEGSQAVQPTAQPAHRPATRPAPPGDPDLVEHPGPALPGWAALLAGTGALAGCAAVLWRVGAMPDLIMRAAGLTPFPYRGLGPAHWAGLGLCGVLALLALGGLGRGRVGHAWVLTLFGQYRGSVRRTGLVWMSPLLQHRRVDVRLRHWRSQPMPAVDANGVALRVVVLVVWQIKDTVRAALAVADHEAYLRDQVEAAMARVLSQLPADAFHEEAPSLRNAEAVGDALTQLLSAEAEPIGIEVFSAQPTRIEYAPEVAAAMQRRRVELLDAKHRDSVLTSVVDAVDDTVNRLTARGLVDLDDYERKALVRDLTVAFYTGKVG
ncbi:SPFH domain-containing protein [Streptomyces sp. SYSU K217416]